MASSQLIRTHLPPDSFIGYFKRRSPLAVSRTDAPLAQCAPRLIGLSQPGSCPVQTPFCTSATTVQPTEQCVQTDFLISAAIPTLAACAGFTFEPTTAAAVANPPIARPDPRKNARRSTTVSAALPMKDDDWGPFATPDVFFLSILSS